MAIAKTFLLAAQAGAVALLVLAGPAMAQEPLDIPPIPDEPGKTESKIPDIENGLKTARALCTACHLIGEEPNSPAVAADVPSFRSIANRPGQSTEALANWLVDPHPPMPQVHLTRQEIRDLSGYILSLKDAK